VIVFTQYSSIISLKFMNRIFLYKELHIIFMSVFQRVTEGENENKQDFSTADRFYDMEESQRRYQ
jgi:hypothetical protein